MHEGSSPSGEYTNWKAGGCEMHPVCLECPLPYCVEEQPRGKQKRRMEARSQAMEEMRRQGRTVKEVAAAFGVSTRTVQRELKRNNGNGL